MLAAHTRGGASRRSSTAGPLGAQHHGGHVHEDEGHGADRQRPVAAQQPLHAEVPGERAKPARKHEGEHEERRRGQGGVEPDPAQGAAVSRVGGGPQCPEGHEDCRGDKEDPHTGGDPASYCPTPATYAQTPSADGFRVHDGNHSSGGRHRTP